MSDQEILDQTNKLAREFYKMTGNVVPENYRFDKAHHPAEMLCWDQACYAQEFLVGTELANVLAELEQ